jgi:hypothetical protein
MGRSSYTIFLVLLILFSGCDSNQGALEDSVPKFYSLTTEVTPDQGGTIQPAGGEFLEDNSLQITARPADGYVFDYWEGDLSGNSNPAIIYFSSNRVVKAHFSLRDYNLSIELVGSGVVNETVLEQTSSFTVRLEAEAEEGWFFDRWDGDLSGDSNPETIVIGPGDEKSVTAIFSEEVAAVYSLDISIEGQGTVEKDPHRSSYSDGDEVKLTASAASGWSFKEWGGDLSGSTNPAAIIMDDDMSVTALFVQIDAVDPDEYTLTVTTEGNGTVAKDPEKSVYQDGDEVKLTASAVSGWNFKEWSGDLTSSKNPDIVTMDGDKNVTAIFEEDPPEEYTLTINTEGDGTVDKDPDKSIYLDGEEVILTAYANVGWVFKEWQGDLSGSANPVTILIDDEKQITATFEVDLEFGITINEVKLFIKEMELGGARRTRDFKTKDFILNLPLDGTPFHITHVQIPAGFYDEMELDIAKLSNSADIEDPDFRDGSNRYSLVVNGVFDGIDFTFRSDEDFQIDVDFSPQLEITSGQTSVIAIDVDFEEWFRGSNGAFMDPNDSRNTKQINKNIEDSFSDFEDRF